MAILRFKNGVERLPDGGLVAFTHNVVGNLTDNINFPSPVPALNAVTAAVTLLSQLMVDAANGDRIAVNAKNAQRKVGVNMLHNIFNYVLFTAAGNRDIAATAGIPFAKTPEPVQITKPTNPMVVNGANKGTLVTSVKRVKGAQAYAHQYTTDPSNPDAWQTMTCTASRCEIGNLTSGTNYYCRIGAVGGNGQVVYSDIIACIVL